MPASLGPAGCLTGGSSPSTASIIHLDKAGREVKRVPVAIGGAAINEVLDNGHVLAVTPGSEQHR